MPIDTNLQKRQFVRSADSLCTASAAEQKVLPDWHELFAALRGCVANTPQVHPVTRCALWLAQFHAAGREHPDVPGFAGTCAALVAFIDSWTVQRCPAHYRGSVGAVVDDMARGLLDVLAALDAGRDIELVHLALLEVAEQAVRWADLVEEVAHGQSRIPAHR
ncbi:hypothetical protein [Nocardia jejuensis]|uniref:hypothetical protein n=1 Tax=Nocardia jejuensis TaxID=328049 RepID=UPI000833CEE4|nr:hypothetical protein [Nocardia jejuensis]